MFPLRSKRTLRTAGADEYMGTYDAGAVMSMTIFDIGFVGGYNSAILAD